ncbi:MAG TPA: hypothetical protein VIK91_13080 [Nannocystis sp.]
MRRGTREIALVSTLLAGCLPELERYEGEHILYEHSASLEVCAGTVDYLDGLIPFLSEQLGVPTPERIRYSWLTQADREALTGSLLRENVGGHAVGYHAVSYYDPALVHEIVHTLMTPHETLSFFAEGLAYAYDDLVRRQRIDDMRRELVDPRPLMLLEARELDYAQAGSFVYFLIARHGVAPFLTLYARLDRPAQLGRIRALFREVYGVDLDEEVERYLSGVRSCDEEHFDVLAARCPAPVLPWRGEAWVFADVMACDAPGVVGGSTYWVELPEFRVTTLEIPQTGIYEISSAVDGDLVARITACFGCPWDSLDGRLDPWPRKYKLSAGRYRVQVEGEADAGARFSVVVRPVDAK